MSSESFHLSAPRPRKKLFYLASPKRIYLGSPRRIYLASPKFYLACPKLRDEYSIKVWRSQIQSKIKSPDSYAAKFLKDVDDLTQRLQSLRKRVEAYVENFRARVKAREECIWGKKESI